MKVLNGNMNSALVHLALTEYHQELVSAEDLRRLCLHPQALKDLHRQGIARALAILRPGRPANQGFDLDDPDERILQTVNIFQPLMTHDPGGTKEFPHRSNLTEQTPVRELFCATGKKIDKYKHDIFFSIRLSNFFINVHSSMAYKALYL